MSRYADNRGRYTPRSNTSRSTSYEPAGRPQQHRSEVAADQGLDDLASQFSRTNLNQGPPARSYRSAPAAAPHGDAINQVVQDVLTRDLRILGSDKLLPEDPIFDLARDFAREWDISDKAVESHIKLACGYFKFPVILLLNPAPRHEDEDFNDMVDRCATLRWIEDVLYGIGLGLRDVIILDICTLLGSDRIRELGRPGQRQREKALSEAYDVTQKMLKYIDPSIILSCQCCTSFPDWGSGKHPIARPLCSSIRTAKEREVKKVNLNERTVNVVQGYHPSGFLNKRGGHNKHHDTFGHQLADVFRCLYTPCGNWKSQHLLAETAAERNPRAVDVSRNNYPATRPTAGFSSRLAGIIPARSQLPRPQIGQLPRARLGQPTRA